MKINKFTGTLAVILAILTVALLFYATRQFLVKRFTVSLIEDIESSTGLGIKAEKMNYIPLSAVRLKGVSVYKSTLYENELCSAGGIYMKVPLLKLLLAKTFSPTIAISGLEVSGISINGVFGMEVKTGVEITSPGDNLKAIKKIWFHNVSAKNAFLNVKDLTGAVNVSPDSIKASRVAFTLNGIPCVSHFEVTEPLGELKSDFGISSPKFTVVSTVKKENEIYKITKMECRAFDSSLELTGELSGFGEGSKGPVLSLYGNGNINVKDIVHFVSADLKKSFNDLNPEGEIDNSIYFKVKVKDLPGWELGIKSKAPFLKAGNVKFEGLRSDIRVKNGLINMPLLNAYLYNGALASSATLDLRGQALPYRVNCKLSNLDVGTILKNTGLRDKGISGNLFSEVKLEGSAKDINTMRGPGKISVTNANLGPMPLLTPLLGHAYGYLQHVFPELKKVNIKAGAADFYVANRRLTTENLVLAGDIVGIYARGYVDFDRNLYFDVENQIRPDASGGDEWQAGLQQMMAEFGKMISKARLTGTLEKPKWKFEYLGGIDNILKGGLQKILKGIFE